MTDREPVGVIGVGWVGLVTAACFAELGHPVVARDILAEKVDALNRGEVTIHEPGLEDLLGRNAENLTFTTDMAELLDSANLLFVCVDTPPTHSGDADLSRVRAVVAELPEDSEHVLIMKSTVPAGTGATIRRDMPGLAYVSCPEFLKEGSAVEDFMHPDRVVIGAESSDVAAAAAVERLYEPLGGQIVRTDVASAEMIKLASNAFLATKISFVNEIANVCEEVGADVSEVARGMGLDNRIGSAFLRAGIGYGGSCFSSDQVLLARIDGEAALLTFAEVWDRFGGGEKAEAEAPEDLWVWSWVPGDAVPEWMKVSVLTRRAYEGQMVTIRTEDGASLRVTADHPVLVGDGLDGAVVTNIPASSVRDFDWLPRETGNASRQSEIVAVSGRDGEITRSASNIVHSTTEAGLVEWVRVESVETGEADEVVYSLKVPGSQTVVTSGGLIVSQCFPKDVSALKMLAGNTGYHFQLLNAVIEVNELQKRRVVGKLQKHLGSLVGKRIALLGLAFKPHTDDMREASSLVLAARLQGEGATVVAHDPVASDAAAPMLDSVEMTASAQEALTGADAAVLVTEWPEFTEIDWAAAAETMAHPLLIDGRNFLDGEALRAAGFTYEGIGRALAPSLDPESSPA